MPNNPIGNVKGFSRDMIKNMLYVIGVGYIGGSIASMGKAGTELFPYDITQPPYAGVRSNGDDESLLEYLWPMKTVGFPYSLNVGSGYSSDYLKWLSDTCAHSFATMRYSLFNTVNIGERISKHMGGGLFRFYVISYLLFGLFTNYSWLVMFTMFCVTLFAATFYAADGYGYMYSLSPVTGWGYGLSLCGKTITVGCLINTLGLGIVGCMLPMIHIPWWFIVTAAVTAYSYVILLFAPFLWTGGLTQTFQEIKNYKRSLVILFMYFTLKSSHQFLTTPVSSGVLLGAVYVLYTLIKR